MSLQGPKQPTFDQDNNVDDSAHQNNITELTDPLMDLGPLKLNLTITQNFMESINSYKCSSSSRERRRDHNFVRREEVVQVERLKASNFPAMMLKIGSWERVSVHDGDLTAKCYFAKKKLVWEILERRLKRKMEIMWADITAIKAVYDAEHYGYLHVEVGQPPSFHHERDPEPRKHTNWIQTEDFTGQQALICRRHVLKFLPGVLDKHYEKLLQCDSRLLHLSEQPYPSSSSWYLSNFLENYDHHNRLGAAQYSISFNQNAPTSANVLAQHQLQAAYHQQVANPSLLGLGSPDSVIDVARLADQKASMWGVNNVANNQVQVQGGVSKMETDETSGFVYQNGNYVNPEMVYNEAIGLNDNTNHLQSGGFNQMDPTFGFYQTQGDHLESNFNQMALPAADYQVQDYQVQVGVTNYDQTGDGTGFDYQNNMYADPEMAFNDFQTPDFGNNLNQHYMQTYMYQPLENPLDTPHLQFDGQMQFP